MRYLVALLLLLIPAAVDALTRAESQMVERGKPYYSLLNYAVDLVWPDHPSRFHSVAGAQVEKESLWNPRAELCVPKPSCSRERGIGFGQMTITPRFNVFQEVGILHPELRDWPPDDYFNPRKQLIAVAAKDRLHYRQCSPLMLNEHEAMACMLSSYNGGFGGFSADRRLCSNTRGCNPQLWFGHVENTSLKAKTPLTGYGQSFFQINRGYVREVLIVRPVKYELYLKD